MNTNEGHPTDDLLDRSLEAMRNEPVPEGPDARTTTNLLLALKKADRSSKARLGLVRTIDLFYEALAMTFSHKIITTVLLTLIGITIWFLFSLLSTVGYAQVAAQLAAVHTMTCTAEVTVGAEKKPTTMKQFYLDDGRERSEIAGAFPLISITDMTDGPAILTLLPKDKTAMLIHPKLMGMPEIAPIQEINVLAEFHKAAQQKGDAIGAQELGGVNAKGFRTIDGGMTMTFWADAKTGALLQVETVSSFQGKTSKSVLHDIVLNPVLDQSLFSLEPPKGYHLNTINPSVDLDLDTNVVTVLKAMSAVSKGKFPEKLNDMSMISKLVKAGPDGQPTPDCIKAASSLGVVTGTLTQYKKGADFDYFPAVQLGDSASIVFWHQDKKTHKCTEIFGDLSVKEVTPEALPRKAGLMTTPAPTTGQTER